MVLTFPCVCYCHMAWFLTAASRKEQALNTFNVQMKFVTSLGGLMYANEVGVCVCTGLRGTGCGVGGWVAAGKTFLIYPPCSNVTKTLSGTRGYIKNDATHKVCTSTSTELALREFTKERFEFKNALLREGKKNPLQKKKKRRKGKRQEEIRSGYRS